MWWRLERLSLEFSHLHGASLLKKFKQLPVAKKSKKILYSGA
jgi:hypothetical protein